MYSAVVVGGAGGKRARIIVAQRITLRTLGSAEKGKLQGVPAESNEYDRNKRRQQSGKTRRREAEELFVDFHNGACPLQVVCV